MTGRVAWVTGATGGLGPAVVRALVGARASIVATSRNEDELGSLQTEIGIPGADWLAYPADLTDGKAVKAAADAARDRFGRLDILVAVAGGWYGGLTVAETDPAALEWLLVPRQGTFSVT